MRLERAEKFPEGCRFHALEMRILAIPVADCPHGNKSIPGVANHGEGRVIPPYFLAIVESRLAGRKMLCFWLDFPPIFSQQRYLDTGPRRPRDVNEEQLALMIDHSVAERNPNPPTSTLHIKLEQQHVAVLHHVFLAFHPIEALFARCRY